MYILIWNGRLLRYDTYKEVIEVAQDLTKEDDEHKKALIIKDGFFTKVEELRWVYDSTWYLTVIEY